MRFVIQRVNHAKCTIAVSYTHLVEALEDKKAEDITVLDIGEVSSIADYFIIANGNNANQDVYKRQIDDAS